MADAPREEWAFPNDVEPVPPSSGWVPVVGQHVVVALTAHEARLLVLAIDDALETDPMVGPLRGVRKDIMDGLASLAKSRLTLTPDSGEA